MTARESTQTDEYGCWFYVSEGATDEVIRFIAVQRTSAYPGEPILETLQVKRLHDRSGQTPPGFEVHLATWDALRPSTRPPGLI